MQFRPRRWMWVLPAVLGLMVAIATVIYKYGQSAPGDDRAAPSASTDISATSDSASAGTDGQAPNSGGPGPTVPTPSTTGCF